MRHFKELSKFTVPELWETRDEIFREDAVDCRELTVDSAGVAFLVKWSQALGDRSLKLLDPEDDLKRLISVFRLEQLFSMEVSHG